MTETKEAKKEMTCICCPLGCSLQIAKHDGNYIITGNKCPRGKNYAIEEMTAPKRVVTSTVKIIGSAYPVLPVKTAKPIPQKKILEIMDILSGIEVTAPIKIGTVIVSNIGNTGVDVIATKNG